MCYSSISVQIKVAITVFKVKYKTTLGGDLLKEVPTALVEQGTTTGDHHKSTTLILNSIYSFPVCVIKFSHT